MRILFLFNAATSWSSSPTAFPELHTIKGCTTNGLEMKNINATGQICPVLWLLASSKFLALMTFMAFKVLLKFMNI